MGAFDDLIPAAPDREHSAPGRGTFDDLIPSGNAKPRDGGSVSGQVVKGIPIVGALAQKGVAAANAALDPVVDTIRGWRGKEKDSPAGNFSDRYSAHLGEERQADRNFEEAHPVAAPALQIGGGLAAFGGGARMTSVGGDIALPWSRATIPGPVGVTTYAPIVLRGASTPAGGGAAARLLTGTAGRSLGGRVASSASSGAALGAGDAYLRDEDPTGAGLSGAAMGAAGPIVGRVAGAIANRARGVSAPQGGQLAPAGRSVADRSVPPTADQLGMMTDSGYGAARGTDVTFHPNVINSLGHTIGQTLTARGTSAEVAPLTNGVVRRLQGLGPNDTYTVNDLINTRQILSNIRHDATPRGPFNTGNGNERFAANEAINHIDNYLSNVPQHHVRTGDVDTLRYVYPEARGNAAAQHRVERAEQLQENARVDAGSMHSGANVNNKTRQALKPILKNEALQAGHSPEELAQLERVVMGTRTGNLARSVAHTTGGGGGLGRMHAATIGGTVGGLLGGPVGATIGAIGTPMVGYAARKIGDASTRRQTRLFNDLVRLNSPAGAGARAARAEGEANNATMMRRGALGSRGAQQGLGGIFQQYLGGD